ncbi:hypothetical protein RIVM261_041260 [Rivularia sp. IAM M-261]|nr:hypothetical protein RIVM261_041260 [Rivularia sp. IAM M-261]
MESSIQPQTLDIGERQFIQNIPLALTTLLERRYLSEFQINNWQIEPRPGDNAHPLLREIVSLGRNTEGTASTKVMPHVLTACHDPGHALISVLHGQGDRHRLYVGGRRIIGKAGGSTQDYLHSQESAFKAYFLGMEMGALSSLDHKELPELTKFLQTAPAFAAITGIPGRHQHNTPIDIQSLDKLVKAVGDYRYVLMTVAEPLEPSVIDQTLDICRRLKSEVHSYIKSTKSRSEGSSESSSKSERGLGDWKTNLPSYLLGLSAFLQIAGMGTLAAPISSMSFIASQQIGRQESGKTRQETTGKNWSESGTTELLDANAEACEQLLQEYIKRLQLAKSNGWWQTAVYIVGENEAAVNSVSGALRSLCSGESILEPMRVIHLPGHILRGAVERGQIMNLIPHQKTHSNSCEILGTYLNSTELALIVNLPQQEIPGIPMREWSNFGLSVPLPTEDSITLGMLQDGLGRDLNPVTISAKALNRHTFVTGMTGYGKTNTCMRLLLESYEKLKVPFLVIEPAKAEYRRLASALKGKLRVYSIGGDSPLPFRLNPFTPVPGIPLGRHIDLLKAVFNASFSMFAGMAYVLEEAILEVYAERGWNLYTSQNNYLSPRATFNERCALTPCLQDLYDKIDTVLTNKKYGQEIHQNMGAAIRSRLSSLMVGNKGLMLNTRRSVPLENLFANPTVIELQNLGDDEEKAFVMALLLVLLYEYAEVRQRNLPHNFSGKLQHLTLVEEAHRLLQAAPGFSSPEVGNPRGKAVAMFTDMLAEMRAYGEGFIIADQIPNKLAPEILKNSNIKIVHRLAAPDDREATGSCINLNERQIRNLNNLAPGFAVIHDEHISEAVLTKIYQVKDLPLEKSIDNNLLSNSNHTIDTTYLHRNAGCQHCSSPCNYYHHLEENIHSYLQPFLESILLDDITQSWQEWSQWHTNWQNNNHYISNTQTDTKGIVYCTAVQGAETWLNSLLSARAKVVRTKISALDKLQTEKALRILSDLFKIWINKTQLDTEAQEIFKSVRTQLIALVATEPPQALPGCQNCPAPCLMLPFVAPHLSSVTNKIESLLKSKQPSQQRLIHIQEISAPIHQKISILNRYKNSKTLQNQWLYCLITNSEPSIQGDAQALELLSTLKNQPQEEQNQEIANIFGLSV